MLKNASYTIPASATQSILHSRIGRNRGSNPRSYNLTTVTYKSHIITDSIEIGNCLRNIQAYKEASKSTYKRKPLNTFVFSIDSTNIKEHLYQNSLLGVCLYATYHNAHTGGLSAPDPDFIFCHCV